MQFQIAKKQKKDTLNACLSFGTAGGIRTPDLWFVAKHSIQLSYSRKLTFGAGDVT